MSRKLGLDWLDVVIHVFVTLCLAVAVSEGLPRGREEVLLPAVFAGSAIFFAYRRRRALRLAPPEVTTGEVQAERLEELEARIADLDLLQARVNELEDRLDFSERLLVQQREERSILEPPRG